MSSRTRVAPLVPPSLYPASARSLLQSIYNEIYSASGGTLNDFSAHSPIVALVEGHVFAILEELYFVNQFPDAAGLSFLATAGIVQILGSAASVTLTFTLSAVLATPFTLSAGYIVKARSGLEFATDSVLVIPAGAISGTVSATSTALISGVQQTAVGSRYNVPAQSIELLTESRAFLQSVTNLEAASGGTDAETLDQTRSRGFAALRRRNVLCSADDYEQAAQTYLGAGSTAIAVGNLASDRFTEEVGAVHIFVLTPDFTAPNSASLTALQSSLAERSPAGLQNVISVSAIEIMRMEALIVATLVPGSDPAFIAATLWAKVGDYLSPRNFQGETVLIKEVEYVARGCGIETLQSIQFNQVQEDETIEVSYSDVPLPNRWTLPHLLGLNATLVDRASGVSFEYSYGDAGDPD